MQNAAPQRTQQAPPEESLLLEKVVRFFASIMDWFGQKMDQKLVGKTEKETYETFYYQTIRSMRFNQWCMLGSLVVAGFIYATKIHAFIYLIYLAALGMMAVMIPMALYTFYGTYKKKAWKYIVKVATGLCISFVILGLTFLIPPLGIVLLIYTIYKNKKRRDFVNRYKRYLYCALKIFAVQIVTMNIIPFVIEQCISFYEARSVQQLARFGIRQNQMESMADAIEANAVAGEVLCFTVIFFGSFLISHILLKFYRKEQAKGISFEDCGKLLMMVPIVWLFFCISVLSLVHSSVFSGDQILADAGFDIDQYMDLTPDAAIGMPDGVAAAAPTASVDMMTQTDLLPPMAETPASMVDAGTDTMQTQLEPMDTSFADTSAATAVQVPEPAMETPAPESVLFSESAAPEVSDVSPMPEQPVMPDAATAPSAANAAGMPDVPDVSQDVSTDTVIQDSQGMTLGRVHQDVQGHVELQDSMQQTIETITENPVTGGYQIHGMDGLSQGTITSDGVIQGIDTLQDGRIVDDGNGTLIVQNELGKTIAKRLPNGVLVDPQGQPLATMIKE